MGLPILEMTKLSSCFCVLIWLFLRREDHVVSGRQRIMNGHRASPRDYPFIARLDGCTGSLMSPTMVLTATHCFYNTTTGKLYSKSCGYAVFNDDDKYNNNNKNEKRVKIKRIMRFNNDLAVAVLEDPVSLTPVRLASEPVPNGAKVRALGYGMIGLNVWGRYLNKIDLEVTQQPSSWKWSNIEKHWVKWEYIKTRVGPNNGGPCGGDSGGPLLVWRNNQWELLATLQGGALRCQKIVINDEGDKWNDIIRHGPLYGTYECTKD